MSYFEYILISGMNRACLKVFWWDMRKISEPTEIMYLDPTKKQDFTQAHSAMCLEYEPTIVSCSTVNYY